MAVRVLIGMLVMICVYFVFDIVSYFILKIMNKTECKSLIEYLKMTYLKNGK